VPAGLESTHVSKAISKYRGLSPVAAAAIAAYNDDGNAVTDPGR